MEASLALLFNVSARASLHGWPHGVAKFTQIIWIPHRKTPTPTSEIEQQSKEPFDNAAKEALQRQSGNSKVRWEMATSLTLTE